MAAPGLMPTYLFCAFLHDAINNGTMGRGTAKRRMGVIQNFYRWLIQDGVKFENPLWQEQDAFISFKDSRGFIGSKKVKSTDLAGSIKINKQHNDYSEHIEDGGKLRPLSKAEQTMLIKALKAIGNPEMMLSFLFSLTTSARLQTVFTLRRCHFESIYPKNQSVIPLQAGTGTLVDTKYNKTMVLLIPYWLYQRIHIYMRSARALRRFRHSDYVYGPENHQYVFLTHAGLPYYITSQDPFIEQFKIPPKGNAVTQFIRQQLQPELKRLDHTFKIRFHDLRATFGMNLLTEKLTQLPEKEDLFTQVSEFILAFSSRIILVRHCFQS
jgi:hypothetical protein